MDIGGDAAFLELLELAPYVKVRLKSGAASRNRIAEDKPVEHSLPPPRAAPDRRYEQPEQCSDMEIADKRLTKFCGDAAADLGDGLVHVAVEALHASALRAFHVAQILG